MNLAATACQPCAVETIPLAVEWEGRVGSRVELFAHLVWGTKRRRPLSRSTSNKESTAPSRRNASSWVARPAPSAAPRTMFICCRGSTPQFPSPAWRQKSKDRPLILSPSDSVPDSNGRRAMPDSASRPTTFPPSSVTSSTKNTTTLSAPSKPCSNQTELIPNSLVGGFFFLDPGFSRGLPNPTARRHALTFHRATTPV